MKRGTEPRVIHSVEDLDEDELLVLAGPSQAAHLTRLREQDVRVIRGIDDLTQEELQALAGTEQGDDAARCLARARLYTICLKERPVLVVSVGLEPSLDDLSADETPFLLTELYAEHFDEIVDSPRILKLWDGDPDTLHVRKPTADEAARWYASFLDRENETRPTAIDEDKDYDSEGGGIPWPWRTEDDWECPLLGTCGIVPTH